MERLTIGGTIIEYDAANIRIIDSYKIRRKENMLEILIWFKLKTNFHSKRTFDSWIREWKSHNRMYRLGMFRSHTKDCDLEENEKLYRRIIYWFLGGI